MCKDKVRKDHKKKPQGSATEKKGLGRLIGSTGGPRVGLFFVVLLIPAVVLQYVVMCKIEKK